MTNSCPGVLVLFLRLFYFKDFFCLAFRYCHLMTCFKSLPDFKWNRNIQLSIIRERRPAFIPSIPQNRYHKIQAISDLGNGWLELAIHFLALESHWLAISSWKMWESNALFSDIWLLFTRNSILIGMWLWSAWPRTGYQTNFSGLFLSLLNHNYLFIYI